MDNSSAQQKAEKQKRSIFSATLQFFDSIEGWIASVFELTEEEQENAGIHLNNQYDK